MTPVLGIVNLNGTIFYTSAQSDWPTLFAKKFSLSLSYLVPEILGPKFGIFFTKIYYLTDFLDFV